MTTTTTVLELPIPTIVGSSLADTDNYDVLMQAAEDNILNTVGAVSVTSFGVALDKSGDQSTALNAAATYARSVGLKLFSPPGEILIDGPVNLSELDLEINAIIYGDNGCDGTYTVRVGGATGVDPDQFRKIYLRGVSKYATRTTGDVGVLIKNISHSTISIGLIDGYDIGVQQLDANSEFSFNNVIYFGRFISNLTDFAVVPTGSGWSNECLVVGGEWDSNDNTHVTNVLLQGNSGYHVDGWIFLKPSFESEYGVNGVTFDMATECGVIDGRCESATGSNIIASFKNTAYNNRFFYRSFYDGGTHDYPAVEYDSTACYGNEIRPSNDVVKVVNPHGTETLPYDDGTDIHVPGFSFTNASGVVTRTIARASGELWDTKSYGYKFYLNLPYACGLLVHPVNKYIQVECDTASWTKLCVICFDSSGTILYGTTPRYAMGAVPSTSSNWYYFSPYTKTINFHDYVSYAFVGLSDGYISNIFRVLGGLNTWAELGHKQAVELPGKFYSTVAPSAFKYWTQFPGDIIYKDPPTASSPMGYIIKRRVDTTIARVAAVATDHIMQVVSTTGMVAGDYIGIQMDTDSGWHITTVDAVTDGDTVTIIDHLTAGAAIGNKVVALFALPLANIP